LMQNATPDIRVELPRVSSKRMETLATIKELAENACPLTTGSFLQAVPKRFKSLDHEARNSHRAKTMLRIFGCGSDGRYISLSKTFYEKISDFGFVRWFH